MNYCPSNLLSGSTPPPPPCVNSIYRQCVAVMGWGGCWVLLETIFCRCLTLWIWPDSELTKLLDHPKQKPRMTTFCIAYYQSNLSTAYTLLYLKQSLRNRSMDDPLYSFNHHVKTWGPMTWGVPLVAPFYAVSISSVSQYTNYTRWTDANGQKKATSHSLVITRDKVHITEVERRARVRPSYSIFVPKYKSHRVHIRVE